MTTALLIPWLPLSIDDYRVSPTIDTRPTIASYPLAIPIVVSWVRSHSTASPPRPLLRLLPYRVSYCPTLNPQSTASTVARPLLPNSNCPIDRPPRPQPTYRVTGYWLPLLFIPWLATTSPLMATTSPQCDRVHRVHIPITLSVIVSSTAIPQICHFESKS